MLPAKSGVAAALSLLAATWQSWPARPLIEWDARLDAVMARSALPAVPPVAERPSITSGWLPWQAPLTIGFSRPPAPRRSALYQQNYYQLVSRFSDLRAPVAMTADHLPRWKDAPTIFTNDALAFARFHADCPTLVLLPKIKLARDRLETGAWALVRTHEVTPDVRAMSEPFAVRVWLGWDVHGWLLHPIRQFSAAHLAAQLLRDRHVEQPPRLSRIVAVGDIMLARTVGRAIRHGPEPLYPFTHTSQMFHSADLVMGNLECAISLRGQPMPNKEYTFRAHPSAVERLRAAGFGLLSLANNHSMDYGPDALKDTLAYLHQAGIKTVGAGRNSGEASRLQIMTLQDGTRIGVLGYTLVVPTDFPAYRRSPGVRATEPDARFIKRIRAAKHACDLLILQFHWGKEYVAAPNDWQRHVAHQSIDAGADLVIGHHPHWIQSVEFYKGKFIAYSLGNFVFDMDHRPKVREGLILTWELKGKTPYQIRLDPVLMKHSQPAILEWKGQGRRPREVILQEMFDSAREFTKAPASPDNS
jgi:poly-gamma-glutamate synthesis protein (capsule biosynthesis protein)